MILNETLFLDGPCPEKAYFESMSGVLKDW
jgi:hypothetical protein